MLASVTFLKPWPQWVRAYPEAIAALCCGGLTLLGGLALHQNWIGIGIWVLLTGYVTGGYASAREGLKTLWQEHQLDVDLLMIVAALGAAALGLWQRQYYLLLDGAILILIFALSGALESLVMHRTARNIRELMQLTPDTARVLRHDQEYPVPTHKLQVGDRILVKPGERVPTDGMVAVGSSTLNQAPITGESIPVDKTVGDLVFAGTINGSGALVVTIHQPPESSLIQRIIRLVEQAQTTAPPSQQFLERFERRYAQVIVVTGILLASLPLLLLGWSWETTLYRALVFLVVASPCALMAAIMPTLLAGIAKGARHGILFKDGSQLETMGQVKAIAFDKTGTLTTGQLQVSDIVPAPGTSSEQVLQIAAALESYSEHPVAQAICRAAQTKNLDSIPVRDAQAQVGQGITGHLAGQPTRIGKQSFAIANLPALPHPLNAVGQRLETEGKTVIWVCQERVLGLIAVADQVRPTALSLIATLKQLGIAVVMISGDNRATAQTVAQAIGLDQVYAEQMPEEKVAVLQQLQQRYGTVAMVGDGINDAPALAQADVGIAMGGAATDVALETADVVLMADRLEHLVQALNIGRRSQRLIRQNIAVALASVGILLCANFWGTLTLPAGVLGHEGSTLLVTLNGLRLLRH